MVGINLDLIEKMSECYPGIDLTDCIGFVTVGGENTVINIKKMVE